MNPLLDVWQFTRDRLAPAYQDLSEDQLKWRAHKDAHSIGELLYHMWVFARTATAATRGCIQ